MRPEVTRVNNEILLPLATRALGEHDRSVRVIAARWVMLRFPDEAEEAGLSERFLEESSVLLKTPIETTG